MKSVYIVKEALAGFQRARMSSLISVSTITFLLFIMGIFCIISLNLNQLITALNAKIDLQVFVTDPLSDDEILRLKARLLRIEGIKNVTFISKKEAALEFEKEFGQEIFGVLDDNPLPSSFQVTVFDTRKSPPEMNRIIDIIKRENGVSEVVFHNQILNKLTRFAQMASFITLILLLMVSIGSLFVVSSTIRLVILTRKSVIETMQLIGATRRFIQSPFIIEGIIQGLLGGICALILIYILIQLFNSQWPGIIVVPMNMLLLLVATGFLFGLVGSLVAIKKFI
jgi:cell division transport system permease protein